jgi:hypothetical protein
MKWDASVSTRVCFLSIKGDASFQLRLLYLDERPGTRAHQSGLVTGFYTARYIVGISVMGFTNEARYSLTSVCNEF